MLDDERAEVVGSGPGHKPPAKHRNRHRRQYPKLVPSCDEERHQRTLKLIFTHPTGANVPWRDIETLFMELDADISEREGSRVAVVLFGEVRVFHRPHPSPNTDKGALAAIRKWQEQQGVEA